MFTWLNTHKILTLFFIVLLLIVASIAFLKYINSEIDKAIHTEASSLSQCKTMPIGHKPCGGPAGYIVYSIETTDVDHYLSLVAIRDNYQAILLGLLRPIIGPPPDSTCNLEMPRALGFADGKCFVVGR